MKMSIVKLKEERCKGCELCISVCPFKLLELHETRINLKGYHPACITEDNKCTGCASCAVMCPDGAISVYREN